MEEFFVTIKIVTIAIIDVIINIFSNNLIINDHSYR